MMEHADVEAGANVAAPLAAGAADGWTLLRDGNSARVPVSQLTLSAENGLQVDAARTGGVVHMSVQEMLGVHRDGARLEFVGYAAVTPAPWCFGLFGGGGAPAVTRFAVSLSAPSEAVASAWQQTALILLGRGDRAADARPLLVLVNPKSGPGRSLQLWNRSFAPIVCRDAGHAVQVLVTERRDHALDVVRDHADLCGAYKGLVIVSGDGLMYEVLQGVMARADWARCARELPLGILPGGSGNGLARSVNAMCGVAHSEVASAVAVARGRTRPLDICAVDVGLPPAADSRKPDGEASADVEAAAAENAAVAPAPRRVYSFLSLEWALIADVDIESEYLRFLGSARFTVQAVLRLIFLRRYRGRLSFLPCADADADTATNAATDAARLSKLPRSAKHEGLQQPPLYWDAPRDPAAAAPETTLLPPPRAPVPAHWLTVEDTFFSMWNCNVAWMAGDAWTAPDADCDDGYIQLESVRERGRGPDQRKVTRWDVANLFLSFESGAHVRNTAMEMTPTRAYRFEPLPDARGRRRGIIAVDGERVEYASVQMENLRGLMRIYASDVPMVPRDAL